MKYSSFLESLRHPFNSLLTRITWVIRQQKGKTTLDFNEARDDEVALASAGPYASHWHLPPDRQPCQHLITQFFTDWMLFLMPNQQCQSMKGNFCKVWGFENIQCIYRMHQKLTPCLWSYSSSMGIVVLWSLFIMKNVHRESKKGATLTMAITLSIPW